LQVFFKRQDSALTFKTETFELDRAFKSTWSSNGVEKWSTDATPARVDMEAGTHLIWISEQCQELGHQVIGARIAENCDAGKTSFTGDTGRMAGVEEDAATGQAEGSEA
jgi:hypothetical protein